MKLLTRSEFVKLPAGIIYKKLYSDIIEIKGSWVSDNGDDWSRMIFGRFDPNKNYGQMVKGESYPIDTSYYGRDGLFESDQMFLIFESWDLDQLKKTIEDAIQVAPEQQFKNPW